MPRRISSFFEGLRARKRSSFWRFYSSLRRESLPFLSIIYRFNISFIFQEILRIIRTRVQIKEGTFYNNSLYKKKTMEIKHNRSIFGDELISRSSTGCSARKPVLGLNKLNLRKAKLLYDQASAQLSPPRIRKTARGLRETKNLSDQAKLDLGLPENGDPE